MKEINFDYKTDYVLEDEIVALRPLETVDFEHLLDYSINEPDIWDFNMGGAMVRRIW